MVIMKKYFSIDVFLRIFFLFLMSFFSGAIFAQQTSYYLLTPPRSLNEVEIYSLENDNEISVASIKKTLQKNDHFTLEVKGLHQGSSVSGTGYFDVVTKEGGGSIFAPVDFLGKSFSIPHIKGSHRYYLLSPDRDTHAAIEIGGVSKSVHLQSGVVTEVDAGANNGLSGVVSSDGPILVGHMSMLRGKQGFAYAVPPASSEIYGVSTGNVVVGAVASDTVITAYEDNGNSTDYFVGKGEQAEIKIGNQIPQDKGSALRILANHPIGGVQYNSASGSSATVFLAPSQHSREFYFSQDVQYAVAICSDSDVDLVLYSSKGEEFLKRKCISTSSSLGKAYFTPGKSMPAILKNSYLIASRPVYLVNDDKQGKKNNYGHRGVARNVEGINTPNFTFAAASVAAVDVSATVAPASPTLNAIPATTTVNPLVVSGTAIANINVRLYVNGELQSTVKSSTAGGFSFSAVLKDGNNSLYVTAVNDSGEESSFSQTRTTSYTNTISRAQGGAISGVVVWTPGVPAQPYVIGVNDLTIPQGSRLIIAAGTEIRFGAGRGITASGTLIVNGSSANPVLITSNATTKSKGDWQGIILSGAGSSIGYATIEYATTGISVNSVTASLSSNTIRNFSINGISVSGYGAAGTQLKSNFVDNVSDVGNCVSVQDSSPVLTGNTLQNCSTGLNLIMSSAGTMTPSVSGNNIITSNGSRGVYVSGSWNYSPLPVITGNQIFGNNGYNFVAEQFKFGASHVLLNATGNWWGTVEPTAISTKIKDFTDVFIGPSSSSDVDYYPLVDYKNYLNSAGGSSFAMNYLSSGYGLTMLVSGLTYDVLGTLLIPYGASLSIPENVTLRFHANSRLYVEGRLFVDGSSDHPVVFTSGRATQARGDWVGITITNYGHPENPDRINNAIVEYADTGIYIAGIFTVASMKNNSVRNFLNEGVHISGAEFGTQIVDSEVENANGTGVCVYIDDVSPTLRGNKLQGCRDGLRIVSGHYSFVDGQWGSPLIPIIDQNNIITDNSYSGIWVTSSYDPAKNTGISNPTPTITGNQIFGNGVYDLYTEAFDGSFAPPVLDLKGNWWGTTDPQVIAAKIYDLIDNRSSVLLPIVDFKDFLISPGGAPVAGNYLIGNYSDTALVSGATYDVIGAMFVPDGSTLTIPQNTTLRFMSGAFLKAKGSLVVNGTSSSPVYFTSMLVPPSRSDWPGIFLVGDGSSLSFATVEYAVTGISVVGANATLQNNTIKNFTYAGIYVSGSGSSGTLLQNNSIDNYKNGGVCVLLRDASPTLTGNRVQHCDDGVYMQMTVSGAMAPTVSGNNIITENTSIGILVDGDSSFKPVPVVNGNQIYGNGQYNFSAVHYIRDVQQIVTIDISGNWWGSTNPDEIASKINDYSDYPGNNEQPIVDFRGFLSAANGSAVAGNYLVGNVSTSTLTAGKTYKVLGALFIPSGNTLTIPANTSLKLYSSAGVYVYGALLVNGTSSSPVVFGSALAPQRMGDWRGITLWGGDSNINYAKVEYATSGITVNGVAATVRNSSIRYFLDYGLVVKGDGASGSLLQNNTVDNLTGVAACVLTENSSPTLTGNRLQNCKTGLKIVMSSAGPVAPNVNGNNIITNNSDKGVYVFGTNSYTPRPVLTGNQILSNGTYNIYTEGFASNAQFVKLAATGNWWGSIDPIEIAKKIYDFTDQQTSTSYPVVDFGGYLNAASGTPISGNFLIGFFDDSTTLVSNTTYDVIGPIGVQAGKTLTIPSGVVLKFSGVESQLLVNGSLIVQGTAAARVLFTAALLEPVKGAWEGIKVVNSTANVSIEYADIESAKRGVSATGGVITIKNTIIKNFSDSGIYFVSVNATSVIDSNFIENENKSGKGIYLSSSSPSITGNRISNTAYGIYLVGASNPSITGNVITENGEGIFLYGAGSNSSSSVPNPVITGNDIFGNATYQLEISYYGASNPVVVNAMNNWWGTPTPISGQHIRYNSSPASTLNFSSPASSPKKELSVAGLVISEPYISPNNDSIKDASQLSASLNKSASWTVSVYTSSNQKVRSYSGTSLTVSASLDGKDSSSQTLANGLYRVELVASGSAGNVLLGVRHLVIDNAPPVLAITAPVSGATIASGPSVAILGTAQDKYLINYVIDYGFGASPASWVQINTASSSVNQSALGTWVISSTSGAAGLPSGGYQLRLRASDKAGNNSIITFPVTLDLLNITAVSQSTDLIRPANGESLRVNFSIDAPSKVQLKIYSEADNVLQNVIESDYPTAGAKSLTWDGRNSQGQFVDDEAYRYVLYATTSGGSAATYDLGPGVAYGGGSGIVTSSFNAHKNDYWKIAYTLESNARVLMGVSSCSSAAFYPYNMVPMQAGMHNLVWDGRDANGHIVSGTCNIYFYSPKLLAPASVIVAGMSPVISGSDDGSTVVSSAMLAASTSLTTSPNIEVKSNPYVVTHSYENISKIVYRIDQDSYVTIKLLPPDVSNFNYSGAIVLANHELKLAKANGIPVDQLVEWRGFVDSDTNRILVSQDGAYTLAILATSVLAGKSSLYKVTLQLVQ